jgi:hypothetical protein
VPLSVSSESHPFSFLYRVSSVKSQLYFLQKKNARKFSKNTTGRRCTCTAVYVKKKKAPDGSQKQELQSKSTEKKRSREKLKVAAEAKACCTVSVCRKLGKRGGKQEDINLEEKKKTPIRRAKRGSSARIYLSPQGHKTHVFRTPRL